MYYLKQKDAFCTKAKVLLYYRVRISPPPLALSHLTNNRSHFRIVKGKVITDRKNQV